jgi:hypothetical protein
VPGISGSVLVDTGLQRDSDAAVRQCKENLGDLLQGVSKAALIRFCEDESPSVVWGKFGMLHWLLNTPEWMSRLKAGNGIDRSSTSSDPHGIAIRAPSPCPPQRKPSEKRDPTALIRDLGRLFEVLAQRDTFPELASLDAHLGLLDLPLALGSAVFSDPITVDKVQVHPYGPFLQELCALDIDLLVFPYDWRLSNAYNATRLARAIHDRWWRKVDDSKIGPDTIPAERKVSIIGHSMGGLIARFYIEAERADVRYVSGPTRRARLEGYRYVRQLITVGTPHLGVPIAYTGFIGRSGILEESGILKWLRIMSGGSLLDSGRPLNFGQQAALFRHWSSIIETFPIYRFMPTDNTEDLLDSDKELATAYRTYRSWANYGSTPRAEATVDLMHSSRHWGWQILADFRRQLIHPTCLDRWLVDKGLVYVPIWNDDFTEREDGEEKSTTVSAYDPGSGRVVTTSRGDGVVPWKSAALYPYSDRADHIRGLGLRTGWPHNLLFEAPSVAAACAKLIDSPMSPSRLPLHRVARDEIEEFVEALLHAMNQHRETRAVISVARIQFHDPVRDGLLPFTYKQGSWDVEPQRLPPGQIYCDPDKKGYICQTQRDSIGRRAFVGIVNAYPKKERTKALVTYGGVILLPASDCEHFLEVLTWNVGTMGDVQRGTSNITHAERQLENWFSTWFEHLRWKGRIAAINVRNVRLSPCSQCVVDLRSIGDLVGKGVPRTIYWSELYSSVAGTGPTDLDEVDKLKASGWTFAEGTRMPKR